MIALAMFMANAVFTSGKYTFVNCLLLTKCNNIMFLFVRIQHWNIYIPSILGHDGYMCIVVNILLWKRVC